MILGGAQAPLILGSYPPLWILENFSSQHTVEASVGGLPVANLPMWGLGVVWISFAHVSLAQSQTNGCKEGWQTWFELCTQEEKQ